MGRRRVRRDWRHAPERSMVGRVKFLAKMVAILLMG